MMKAHGIYQSAESLRDTPVPSARRKVSPACKPACKPSPARTSTSGKTTSVQKTSTAPGGAKKRKFDQFAEGDDANKDDEEPSDIVKPEPTDAVVKRETIIEEPAVTDSVTSTTDHVVPYPSQLHGVDEKMFDDFLASTAVMAQQDDSHQDSIPQCAGPGVSSSGKDIHESILIAD